MVRLATEQGDAGLHLGFELVRAARLGLGALFRQQLPLARYAQRRLQRAELGPQCRQLGLEGGLFQVARQRPGAGLFSAARSCSESLATCASSIALRACASSSCASLAAR